MLQAVNWELKLMTNFLKKCLITLILLLNMTISFSMPPSMCNTPLTNQAVEFFANSSVQILLNLNFTRSKDYYLSQAQYLNEDAWKQYMYYLNASTLSSQIEKDKAIVSSYFKTAAKVFSEDGGIWRVQVPLFISVQSEHIRKTLNTSLSLDIIRNDKDTNNCGLKINKITFDPAPAKPFWPWNAPSPHDFDGQYVPYKATEQSNLSACSSDLIQPEMTDDVLVTVVNLWLLKQTNFDRSKMDSPIIILQKGIINNTYAWRLQVNKQTPTIMVTRSLNQDCIDIRFD
jgi:hypothetical protein